MSYAKIVVPVTGAAGDAIALQTAFLAARPFNAHVEALFLHPDPREVAATVYSGAPIAPEIVQSIVDGQTRLTKDAEANAFSALTAAAKDANALIVPSAVRSNAVTASFHVRYGFMPTLVREAARFADLVVFKPITGEERPELSTALAETLTHTNRPVLLPAQKHVASFAKHIAVCWDGHDAAVHAATAAIPLLKQADVVDIMTVQAPHHAVTGAGALRDYLGLHGVQARVCPVEQDHRPISEALMFAAHAKGCDLLVMGGYGHSRLRETFLGGVTLDLVSHHEMPVLLMH